MAADCLEINYPAIGGPPLSFNKKHSEALEAFEQAISSTRLCKSPVRQKGKTLESMGQTEEAEKTFAQAKELGFKAG